MLKDKYIHDRLGIPIQTLQNWKKSEGYTYLLYSFLVNQNQKSFDLKIDSLLDDEEYKLMTLRELTAMVEVNWNKMEGYSDYRLITESSSEDKEESLSLSGIHSDGKQSIIMRFVSGIYDKEEKLKNDIKHIVKIFDKEGLEKPKIIYVVNTIKNPKYFGSYKDYVSMISYSDLVKKFTQDKIIII